MRIGVYRNGMTALICSLDVINASREGIGNKERSLDIVLVQDVKQTRCIAAWTVIEGQIDNSLRTYDSYRSGRLTDIAVGIGNSILQRIGTLCTGINTALNLDIGCYVTVKIVNG